MTNMSDLPFAALAAGGGFAADPRFALGGMAAPPVIPEDPVECAHADGYAAGYAEAEAAGAAQLAEALNARGTLDLAVIRHNAELEEHWRRRLETTVELLCNAALAPLAIDPAILASRVAQAAAMLSRADDHRLLRLHPSDLALVQDTLPEGLAVEADPALLRGTIRIETAQGGVEDGPETWRAALVEALAQC